VAGSISLNYTSGKVTSEIVYDNANPANIIKSSSFTYNASGNLSTEVITFSGKTITKTYTYNVEGNLSNVTITVV